MTVAALYVDPNGVYANLPDVEVWDKARDARTYDGPWPVVAHPPCARWCALAGLVQHVYGYQVGDDGGCFAAALNAVRRFGGVLEHPEHSLAWRAFDLPRPIVDHGWTGTLAGEWVCRVEQGHYGHRGRKPTWLYAFGVDPRPLRFQRTPRVADVGWWIGGRRRTAATRLRVENASGTPTAFRDELLAMARTVPLDARASV